MANEEQNTPANHLSGPLAAQGKANPLTQYERDVLRSVSENHIWLNAFACVRPTDELKLMLADQILAMLNDKDSLICDYQDSENETLRELGQLAPQLVVRINKS